MYVISTCKYEKQQRKHCNTVFQIIKLDLAKFLTHPSFLYMHVLIVCKYEKDQMKNSRENVISHFLHFKSGIFFSNAQGQPTRSPWSDLTEFLTHSSSYVYHRYLQVWNENRLRICDDAVFPTVTLSVAMETSSRIWPYFELIGFQALMHVLITCKYEKDPIKNRENMMTSFTHYKYMGFFSCPRGQLTP